MNHYFFKYSIEQIKTFFSLKRITSVSIHSLSSFSIRFKNCNHSLYIDLSLQNSIIIPIKREISAISSNDVPFFMFLKKKLPGLILTSAAQRNSERVAYLYFEDIRGSIINNFIIIVEMVGRFSNVIFTDSNYIVQQAYKHTEISRTIAPHKKYEPPLVDMPDMLVDDIGKLIARFRHNENILGMDGKLRKMIKKEEDFINFVETVKKTFKSHDFSLYLYGKKHIYPFKINDNAKKIDDDFVFEYLILQSEKNDFLNRKKNLKSIAVKRFNSLKRRLEKIKNELQNAEDAETFRVIAENLISNPKLKVLYKQEIVLKDIYSSEDLTIKLNPKLNVFENAQMYFKKYKKAKKGVKIIKNRLKETHLEIEFMEQILFDIENADTQRELEDVRETMISESVIRTRTKRTKHTNYLPYEHKKIMGFDVYIGKNARGNDYVTMKLANKYDLWFHAHSRPSAHLILKNHSRLQNIDDNVKMACAYEVALRTKAADGEKIDVDYTFVKNIKKPKGLKVGLVYYSDFKSIRVKRDEPG